MTIIFANGPKGTAGEPETIEDLIKVLETEILNPRFGTCRFVQGAEYCFWGNFLIRNYPFHLVTDDVDLILKLSKAIDKNMETEAYQVAWNGYTKWGDNT
jgi:hypothetical protein